MSDGDEIVPDSDRTVQFISKLVQLTQDKKLEWQALPSSSSGGVFLAEVDDRQLRLYKYSEQVPVPAGPSSNVIANTFSSIAKSTGFAYSTPTMMTKSGVRLAVSGKDGVGLYTFDDIAGLSDLYESASYSAAQVDELIDFILKKD